MELIANLIKVYIPNYMSRLPIPNSMDGWSRLEVSDWISLIPPIAIVTYVGYLAYYKACCPYCVEKAKEPLSKTKNQHKDDFLRDTSIFPDPYEIKPLSMQWLMEELRQ